ncbi:MAG: hypothetical protein ACFHXK_00940 [bacterium]
MKFAFIARSGEQSLPLEVDLPYRPGKQTQRARRVAVGELLALLEAQQAQIDASGEDSIKITLPDGVWIIAQGGGVSGTRGQV